MPWRLVRHQQRRESQDQNASSTEDLNKQTYGMGQYMGHFNEVNRVGYGQTVKYGNRFLENSTTAL